MFMSGYTVSVWPDLQLIFTDRVGSWNNESLCGLGTTEGYKVVYALLGACTQHVYVIIRINIHSFSHRVCKHLNHGKPEYRARQPLEQEMQSSSASESEQDEAESAMPLEPEDMEEGVESDETIGCEQLIPA